jgi:rhamnose transport system ATP-binding protein
LLYPIDLEVRVGEVLGIAGLVGSGRSSLLRTLAGLEARAQGTLTINGTEHSVPRHPRAARKLGMALLPEDRKDQGLVLQQSAAVNVVLPDFGSVARGGVLRPKALIEAADHAAGLYGFDRRRLRSPVAQLSGGNQQKLLLARWRYALPRILLADEPTRGIDVGAKAEILTALREAAGEGLAVVVVSSELEEITAISDRIIVMRDGRAVQTLDCHASDVDVDTILRAAFAVSAQAPSRPVKEDSDDRFQ